jgi:hypothetical protein
MFHAGWRGVSRAMVTQGEGSIFVNRVLSNQMSGSGPNVKSRLANSWLASNAIAELLTMADRRDGLRRPRCGHLR